MLVAKCIFACPHVTRDIKFAVARACILPEMLAESRQIATNVARADAWEDSVVAAEYWLRTGQITGALCLAKACKYGHVQIVEHVVSHCRLTQVDLDFALFCACFGGQVRTADIVIDRGARDFDRALCGAAAGDSREMIRAMLERGASNLAAAFECACRNHSCDALEYLMSRGCASWNAGLRGACAGGHIDLAELMVRFGASDFDSALLAASSIEAAEFAIARGGCVTQALFNAIKHDETRMLELLARDADPARTTYAACLVGARKVVHWLISRDLCDADSGLLAACSANDPELAALMLARGAGNVDLALRATCRTFGKDEVLDVLLAAGGAGGASGTSGTSGTSGAGVNIDIDAALDCALIRANIPAAIKLIEHGAGTWAHIALLTPTLAPLVAATTRMFKKDVHSNGMPCSMR